MIRIRCAILCLLVAACDESTTEPVEELLPTGTFNGSVLAMIEYSGKLVAAGDFDSIDGESSHHIAVWNGTGWSRLGAGVNGSVKTLAVFGGALIAAGHFDSAGHAPVGNIALWDGSNWSTLGFGTNDTILALAVLDSILVAGGVFSQAGGQSASGVASWNGAAWQSMAQSGSVNALVVFRDTLIAGGSFGTSRWVNSTWLPMPKPFHPDVGSLCVYNGELIAGPPDEPQQIPIGQWLLLLQKLTDTGWVDIGTAYDGVRAMLVFQNELISGSHCSSPCLQDVGPSRFDGGNWIPMGPGPNTRAFALYEYRGQLFAGGGMFTLANGQSASHFARWDGTGWYR